MLVGRNCFVCLICFWILSILCQYVTTSVIVIRNVGGDKFETSNCNKCGIDNAYCSPPNYCMCNFYYKTYYKVEGDKPGCVSDSNQVEGCKFHIKDLSSRSRQSYFALKKNHILGDLNHASKLENCKIHSGAYWIQYSQWGNLFDGTNRTLKDFKIAKVGIQVWVRFIGGDSFYTGLLIKLQLSCGEIHSCVAFKSLGIMKTMDTPVKDTSTDNSTTTETNLAIEPKRKKETDMPKWLFCVVIGLSVLVLLIVTISCAYCLKRKNEGSSRLPCFHKKSHRPRGNTFTGTALLSVDPKESLPEPVIDRYKIEECDDAVYLDPDAVFESRRKPKENHYDYAYMNSHNMKNKIPKSPSDGVKNHEYADISDNIKSKSKKLSSDGVTNHEYADISGNIKSKFKRSPSDGVTNHEYADITPEKVEHPYANPDSIPCPESRKSIGYAILDGATKKTIQRDASEYQPLMLQNTDSKKSKNDRSPDSPTYFQLEGNFKDENENNDDSDEVAV